MIATGAQSGCAGAEDVAQPLSQMPWVDVMPGGVLGSDRQVAADEAGRSGMTGLRR